MMTRLLLLITIVVSLLMGTGCKKSETAGSPSEIPATTKSPSVKPLSSSPLPKLPVDLATVTPVKTFQVKPPISFSSDQLPSTGVSEFTFDAKAGQYLQLIIEQDRNRLSNPSPSVALVDISTGIQLKPMDADFCLEQMFSLPTAGQYRLAFDPLGQKSTIHFSTLESDAPLINAGIRPEDVSIDLGVFGQTKKVTLDPYDYTCEVGESWPANLLVNSDKISFRIMRTAGYTSLFPGTQEMQLLQESLRPGATFIEAKRLPYASSDDAATVMSARPELIAGTGWRAWRWLEGQAQDGDYPADENLAYTVEGLTNDGRFFFRMRGYTIHPDVRRLNPSDSVPENDTQLRLQLEKALAVAKPDSFTPNLDQLDAVIRSLKFLH
jgi:hypothetical protein